MSVENFQWVIKKLASLPRSNPFYIIIYYKMASTSHHQSIFL
jgi:hypothetical protein